MTNKKIFVLLPDGVGLKNFAFSNFNKLGSDEGHIIKYWNATPFDLNDLGFEEIKIQNSKSHLLTEIYKNARKHIELNRSVVRTKDSIYNSYRFPFVNNGLKKVIKSGLTQFLIISHFTEKGLQSIRNQIKKKERKTLYYQQSVKTLEKEQPALVFCTNQRPMTAIAPLLAAQDLGIPTATFIFSWDNLPKATMVVETDYYFVWSDHMKKELLLYYPYINNKQIFITGTPQFESHFDQNKLLSRNTFFRQNSLDFNKKYICYSGDDVTTSPNDPKYLEDVAIAIRELNKKGYLLGIIFRRCPVDFSSRFDKVLDEYEDVITAIAPLWKKAGIGWNTALPTQEDSDLQMNTIAHTEMVINLGSSMVFDYAAHQKSCAFINYDIPNSLIPDWSVKKIYNYIHFRSMPNKDCVYWIDKPETIANIIENVVKGDQSVIKCAIEWFGIINQHPQEEASCRIWKAIEKIIS